jgi:AbrB family looped-hinge helix DNA binding protein
MEKRIRVSTQGRLTIPKQIRNSMKIEDGQPIIIKSVEGKRELVIELMSTMGDFPSA